MHTRIYTYTNANMYAKETKHTQEPMQEHTQKPAHIMDMLLRLKDRFHHFCHHRVHYQESNISLTVQQHVNNDLKKTLFWSLIGVLWYYVNSVQHQLTSRFMDGGIY